MTQLNKAIRTYLLLPFPDKQQLWKQIGYTPGLSYGDGNSSNRFPNVDVHFFAWIKDNDHTSEFCSIFVKETDIKMEDPIKTEPFPYPVHVEGNNITVTFENGTYYVRQSK